MDNMIKLVKEFMQKHEVTKQFYDFLFEKKAETEKAINEQQSQLADIQAIEEAFGDSNNKEGEKTMEENQEVAAVVVEEVPAVVVEETAEAAVVEEVPAVVVEEVPAAVVEETAEAAVVEEVPAVVVEETAEAVVVEEVPAVVVEEVPAVVVEETSEAVVVEEVPAVVVEEVPVAGDVAMPAEGGEL